MPNGQTQATNITQSVTKDGVTFYALGDQQMAADHKVYNVPDSDQLKGGTFSAWCDDDITLKTEITGEFYQTQGTTTEDIGHITQDLNFSLNAGNLQENITLTVKNAGGTYPPQTSVLTCTKN